MRPIRFFNAPRRQSGVALITGLIFLVMLTLIALTAMQSTTLEERMAGNTRSRDMAFQSGEAAVRAAEKVLGGVSLPAFNGTKAGYYVQLANGAAGDYWINTHDWAAKSVLYSGALTGVKEARFVIEALPANLGSCGDKSFVPKPNSGGGIYRITSRGVAADGTSRVIVQTTFRSC